MRRRVAMSPNSFALSDITILFLAVVGRLVGGKHRGVPLG